VQRVEQPDLGVQGNANHRVAVPAADDQLLCARGRLRYPHALPCIHPSSRRKSLSWECAPLQSGRVDVSRSHWHADPFAPLLNSPVRFYVEVDERAAGVHPSFHSHRPARPLETGLLHGHTPGRARRPTHPPARTHARASFMWSANTHPPTRARHMPRGAHMRLVPASHTPC
jgi:hypothetical protein